MPAGMLLQRNDASACICERPDLLAGEKVAAGAQIQSSSSLELLWILSSALPPDATCFINKVIYRNETPISKDNLCPRPHYLTRRNGLSVTGILSSGFSTSGVHFHHDPARHIIR